MVQELIFTSAPQGLKPGSRGFATVATTAGMSPPLTARLEALSAYTPAFSLSDANYGKNPVCFSHAVIEVGGQRCHVLSRVAPCGSDYSGRSNVLAHHVVLEGGERQAAGPAALCSVPGWLSETWSGPPRILERRGLPGAEGSARVCSGWQKIAGDAGWGGVLGQSFASSPQRPVVLIHAAGVDMLALLRESMALMPAEKRWGVTFTTCYTGPAAGASHLWRCVLAGTAAARSAARGGDALVLDLTRALGAPAAGVWTEAARAGRVVEPRARAAAASSQAQRGEYELTLSATPAKPARAVDDSELGPNLLAPPPLERSSGRKKLWLLAAAIVLLLAALGIVAVKLSYMPKRAQEKPANPQPVEKLQQPVAAPPAAPVGEHAEPASKPAAVEPEASAPPMHDDAPKAVAPEETSPMSEAPVTPAPKVDIKFEIRSVAYDSLVGFSAESFTFNAVELRSGQPVRIKGVPRFLHHMDRAAHRNEGVTLRPTGKNLVTLERVEGLSMKKLGIIAASASADGTVVECMWSPEAGTEETGLGQLRIGLSEQQSSGLVNVLYFAAAHSSREETVQCQAPSAILSGRSDHAGGVRVELPRALIDGGATVEGAKGGPWTVTIRTQYKELLEAWEEASQESDLAELKKQLADAVEAAKSAKEAEKKAREEDVEKVRKRINEDYELLSEKHKALAAEVGRFAQLLSEEHDVLILDEYNVPVLRYRLRDKGTQLPVLEPNPAAKQGELPQG